MRAFNTSHAFLFGLAMALASTAPFVGCSGGDSGGGGGGTPPPGAESTGTVGLRLTLPGGEAVGTVSYAISGPNSYAGTEDVSGTSSTFSFVIPGVAPGSGYSIALTATTTDGTVKCEGTSSAFAVAANQTTAVNVYLACTSTSEAGAVFVNGSGFNCATLHTAVANPASVATGGTVALTAFATGPDPAGVTYQWSAPAGTITNATSANATFTCPAAAGDVPVTLTVGDGSVPAGGTCPAASSTTTLTVSCGMSVSLVPACVEIGSATYGAACDSASSASFSGVAADTPSARFAIANQGASTTGPLVVSLNGYFNGNCQGQTVAPGDSCVLQYNFHCYSSQQGTTEHATATISDPKSGASTTLTADATCYCTAHFAPCTQDADCCAGPGGAKACNPIYGCM